MWYQKCSDPSSFLLFVEKRKLSHHPERYLFPCYLFQVIIIFKPTVSSAMTPITFLASYQALVIVSRFDQKDFGFLVVFCYFSHAATSLGAVSLLLAPPLALLRALPESLIALKLLPCQHPSHSLDKGLHA
jgi:hypothetical protein